MQTQIQGKANALEVHGVNSYCGPAVISAITGLSTDAAAAEINKVRGKPYWFEVKGAYLPELKQALKNLNHKTEDIPYFAGSSVFQVLTSIKKDGYYIALLGPSQPHFVLLEKRASERWITDNRIKTPMKAEGSVMLRHNVLAITFVGEREKLINLFEEWGIGGY